MMRLFKLSRYRLAKVWLDEAPQANFSASSTEIRTLRPTVRLEASRGIAVAPARGSWRELTPEEMFPDATIAPIGRFPN